MQPIITVENVSKRYRIGTENGSYRGLRDLVTSKAKLAFRRQRQAADEKRTLWALKDINFEVRPGEVLGLIGHNGAGKSTLLKILSRITEPTDGRIQLFGRIGSLLEVGTGFHPELTGRENIYLNGAILGMSKEKIDRKFDEIVAFSEVERFLDTPVKRYSSGMYVRLAFSVAAHMEPEILLVDEVLSVGDLAFQSKCFKHMRRLKQSGMTILLVSHSMMAVQGACQRSLYLDHGRLVAFGDTEDVIREYQGAVRQREREQETALQQQQYGTDTKDIRVVGFEMFGDDGRDRRRFKFGEAVRIRMRVHAAKRVEAPLINFGIKRSDGVIVCNFNNWFDNFRIDFMEGECTLEGWLSPLRLIPAHYEIHVLIWQRESGQAEGDLNRIQPLVGARFGDFAVEGLPMTDHDGVFQQPALKWVFTRGNESFAHDDIDDDSLFKAFGGRPQPAIAMSGEQLPPDF